MLTNSARLYAKVICLSLLSLTWSVSQASDSPGRILIQCNIDRVHAFRMQASFEIDLPSYEVQQPDHTRWLAFGSTDPDQLGHAVFDCSRAFKTPPDHYRVRLIGRVDDKTENAVRTILGTVRSVGYIVKTVPSRISFELNQINGSLDAAMMIGDDLRYSKRTVDTVVPKTLWCPGKRCAIRWHARSFLRADIGDRLRGVLSSSRLASTMSQDRIATTVPL